MTLTWERFRPALDLLLRPPDGTPHPTLDELAGASHLSRFHFQRAFVGALGETGKQLALRLRLSQAAAALVSGPESVTDVGLLHGFGGPDTFTRAFRRRFGMTPSDYRRRGLLGAGPVGNHAQVVTAVAPCVRLYRATHQPTPDPSHEEDLTVSLDITVADAPEQHALLVRRRISPAEIAKHIGEILPAVFTYVERVGAALTGAPVVRYAQMTPGSMTIEAGFPVAAPVPGEGDIEPATLGGSKVATAVHAGPYERLGQTWQELERWADDQGLARGGAPWEQYVTDPGEEPDPERWRTVLYLPVE